MPRGTIPRQPSKSGRHTAAKESRGGSRMPKASAAPPAKKTAPPRMKPAVAKSY